MSSFPPIRAFIQLLFAAVLFSSCNPKGAWKAVPVDSSEVVPPFTFRSELIARDTSDFEQIVTVDSLHIWVLQSMDIKQDYVNNHRGHKEKKYFLKTTRDGGRHWENYKEWYFANFPFPSSLPCEPKLLATKNGRHIVYILDDTIFHSGNAGKDWGQKVLPHQETSSSIETYFHEADTSAWIIVNQTDVWKFKFPDSLEKVSITPAFYNSKEYVLSRFNGAGTSIGFARWIGQGPATLFTSDNNGISWDSVFCNDENEKMRYYASSYKRIDNAGVVLKGDTLFLIKPELTMGMIYTLNKGKKWQELLLTKNLSGNSSVHYSPGLNSFMVRDYAGIQFWLAGDTNVYKTNNDFSGHNSSLRDGLLIDNQGHPILKTTENIRDSDYNSHERYSLFKLFPYKYSSLQDYQIIDGPSTIIVKLKLDIPDLKHFKPVWKLSGLNEDKKSHNEGARPIHTKISRGEDSTVWQLSFDPDSINVDASKNYQYYLDLTFQDNGAERHHEFGPLTYRPVTIVDWIAANKWIVIPAGIIISWFIILLFILWLRPIWLFRVYNGFPLFTLIEGLAGKYGNLLRILSEITFVPLFVKHKRTLDAWTRQYGPLLLSGFEGEITVKDHPEYVSLPVKLNDLVNGKQLDAPAADNVSALFNSHRTALEIIGTGGSGKTTLAIQLARWANDNSHQEKFGSHSWIPVLVEEEVMDLVEVLKRKIKSLTDLAIDKSFLESLLSKKRLLVIIDALSERTKEMQQYIKTIHGNVPVNALIITSRNKIDLEIIHKVYIYPQSLGSDKLLYFMSSLLVHTNYEIFKSTNNQIKLGEKLSRLFVFKGKDVPIIPILLRLAIDRALQFAELNPANKDIDQLLESIPDSIPDVYFDYLNRVNPKGDVPNKLSNDEMRKVAELVAQLSLGNDFIPKDIRLEEIVELLRERKLSDDDVDPIQRLTDNGILIRREYAGETFIRFLQDPLSEYLASMWWAKKCGSNKEEWDRLYSRIEELGDKASGFREALEVVQSTYAAKFGWAEHK